MSIKKTINGTYHLKVYIPNEVQPKLGLGAYYEKRFKTRREAKEAELKLSVDIEKAKLNKHYQKPIRKEDILFADFYKEAGQTTTTNKPPTLATVFQTENLFRLHILPLLGKYSISYLNENKQLVLSLLTGKANSYAISKHSVVISTLFLTGRKN